MPYPLKSPTRFLRIKVGLFSIWLTSTKEINEVSRYYIGKWLHTRRNLQAITAIISQKHQG